MFHKCGMYLRGMISCCFFQTVLSEHFHTVHDDQQFACLDSVHFVVTAVGLLEWF